LLKNRLTRTVWRGGLRLYYLLFQRHRHNRVVLERVAGRPVLVLPQVMNPKLFRTGAFLAQTLDARLIPPGTIVLDMGTGSGVLAVTAATWARQVIAVDVNPAAVRCARINVLLNQVEDRVEVRQGDLFAPVPGERFDVVLFNPPFFRGRPGRGFDTAWRSHDTVERFAHQLHDHLVPGGQALVILSSDGETAAFLRAFTANGFDVSVVARRDLINELLIIYRLTDRS
jgi:release factor glutamine methyltransferase